MENKLPIQAFIKLIEDSSSVLCKMENVDLDDITSITYVDLSTYVEITNSYYVSDCDTKVYSEWDNCLYSYSEDDLSHPDVIDALEYAKLFN